VQGSLEASNVNLVEEMVNLMVAQRAYESSVKVLQASDEMLAMSNNLRK
jgi:flagellar basal-body rod protein FlgG